MTKMQFLMALHDRLSGLPRDEAEQRLSFYSEMIEDRMEEGLTEEEAVGAVGSVEDIAAQILEDVSLVKLAKEKIKPKRQMKAWEITLLAVGSIVWIPLLLAAVIVAGAVLISLWAILIALWVVFVSLIASGVAVTLGGVLVLLLGRGTIGIALIGAALICISLGIFCFYGCLAASKGAVALVKLCIRGIKKCLVKKEAA